jgi:C4-dicarboxylate-specific signal transduction histidine kinase
MPIHISCSVASSCIVIGASTIPITIGDFVKPVFDWRHLQRWGINESRLPAGSEIRFRPPTAWEQYRLQIILIAAAVLGQSLLIAGLLYQRRRRQAELETRQRVAELTRMNRHALAGEMSSTIAHELSQPLTTILLNAETAHDLLGRKNLDPEKIREIVSGIIEADARASKVIDRVRNLLWKGESKREIIDLNELVESTLRLTHSELVKRWITVETALAADLPATAGDPAQLQQVLLNLLINAMDAVGSKTPPRRIIKISTRVNGKHVEVDITDCGHGIAADDQQRVFEPLFTTKDQGLGLGLFICSTIVKAHEGKLSIHNNDLGGATAVLSLPVAPPQTERLVNPILPPIPLATRDLRKVIANP